MMKNFTLICLFLAPFMVFGQDTTVVQTLTYDSTAREGVWTFPNDPNTTYEKILLQYSMRCHNAAVGNGNVGCREWDYHCNTVITDSSRLDSLQRISPSHIISNFDGDTFPVSFAPTYTYYQYDQQEITYQGTISEVTGTVNSGSNVNLEPPFGTATPRRKTQFLYTASELQTAGFAAGDFSGLRLDLASLGSSLDFLRIRMKETSLSALDPVQPETDGFTEVYFLNTTFAGTGVQSLNFPTVFNWNGTSNIIVEFSYQNAAPGTNSTLVSDNITGIGMTSSDENRVLEINGAGGIDVPTNAFSGATNQITISFWAYGDASLPINTTVLEGKDASGDRQVNVHLPWGNGQVYWDCGNDGSGYDRINVAVSPSDFKDQWTHWAFTKNSSTGEMFMYMNGHLIQSGTGKGKTMDIRDFRFGNSLGNTGYRGRIDEFRVWDTALDSTTIQDWMFRDISPSHPNYANLMASYTFDADAGNNIIDDSPNNLTATRLPGPIHRPTNAWDYTTNFQLLNSRPVTTFVRGTYQSTTATVTILDSLLNAPNNVDAYTVVGTDLTLDNSSAHFQGGYQYVYNEAGAIVDSVWSGVDSTVAILPLVHFAKEPSRYEILSFITPYGNGLDLGPNGEMWTIDVTDFAPILKGKRRMSIEGVGKNQEEMDLRFLFIEGTPPRDVMDVQPIWPITGASQIWSGILYDDILADNRFEPRHVPLMATASAYKVRTAVTGHGQNGEFIPRWHWINIDGGVEDDRWQAWKECSEIPIFPQGGTWLYDRAGWCPGDPTDVQEFDFSALVNPGDTVEIDYGMDAAANTSASNYRIASHLVTYGAINHALDAHLVEVKRPSKRSEFIRYNPACNEPTVVIQNTGSTTLTSLTITYQVRGGTSRTYQWTGSLDFLESEEVALPIDNPTFWQTSSPENVFEATISAPNGGQDEYPNNDHYASEFDPWASYVGGLTLRWRTNNKPQETRWKIYDETGAIVLQNSPFLTGNTIYLEDLNLPMGCYTLEFTDVGDDGLYYWALTSQGIGFAHFRQNGTIQEIFEPEFGGFFQYDFWTDGIVGDVDVTHPEYIRVYPNPSEGDFWVEMQGWESTTIQAEVYDLQGRRLYQDEFQTGQGYVREQLPLQGLAPGHYFLKLNDGQKVHVKDLVIQ